MWTFLCSITLNMLNDCRRFNYEYCKAATCTDDPKQQHKSKDNRPSKWSVTDRPFRRFIRPENMTADECTAFVMSHLPTV